MIFDFIKQKLISRHSSAVRVHYDRYNANYREYLGEIIQGSRTVDEKELLEYLAKSMGIRAGQKLIDAGSGFGGPAVFFAENLNVVISAVTINEEQEVITKTKIKERNLSSLVTVRSGDFHFLSDYFAANSYDGIYFLESFCHAYDYKKVLKEAYKVLKPGGFLYIKDYLINESLNGLSDKRFADILDRINRFYKFKFTQPTNTPTGMRALLEATGFKSEMPNAVSYIHDNFEKVSLFHQSCQAEEDNYIAGNLEDVFKVVGMYELRAIKRKV